MDLKMLIERVKADDADALNTIYEAYVPMMRNVCFSITKADEDTVNDLVQDAFILAYYSIEKLNDEEKFGEWTAAIAKNVSLKYLERKRKVKFLPLSHYLDNMNVESGVSADAVLAEKELMQLIDRLPEGYGKVFRMSVIEGLSHKEIAERLGIEPHSSSSQLARAKAMLRKMINRRMLAVISAIIVMIPLCKYLFQRRGTEEKKTVTAKVEGTKVKSKKTQHIAKQPSVTPIVSDNYITKTSTTASLPQGGADLDLMPKNAVLEIRDTAINIAVAVPPTDSVARDSIQYNIPIFENHMAEDGSKKHKSKWQLLVAGSLGPALVQNAYKLFAGIGDDITDSPTTDIPKVISTWEDYYKFLVRKGGKVSPDTAALITIAEHNTGKIVEREQHDKPITLGLALTKSLGKNWSIESGLQYSLLKSNFTMGEGAYYIQRTQKVHYLGLPFRLSYKWLRSKRWSVYSSAGVLLDIPLVGEAKERYVPTPQFHTRAVGTSHHRGNGRWVQAWACNTICRQTGAFMPNPHLIGTYPMAVPFTPSGQSIHLRLRLRLALGSLGKIWWRMQSFRLLRHLKVIEAQKFLLTKCTAQKTTYKTGCYTSTIFCDLATRN